VVISLIPTRVEEEGRREMGETKEREKKYNKGPFTLGVRDTSVESTNTMLVI
jgi:hypothetical protein